MLTNANYLHPLQLRLVVVIVTYDNHIALNELLCCEYDASLSISACCSKLIVKSPQYSTI